MSSELPLRGRSSLRFDATPLVMGIINITPDSFSDGGEHLDCGVAVAAALQMLEDGADLLDLGAESTRPGAEEITVAEELDRLLPVLRGIRRVSMAPISIDTRKSAVAAAALQEGGDIINDVSALRHDPKMADVVARSGAALILMHMRGTPKTMQQNIHFDDVLAEVSEELEGFCRMGEERGIGRERMLVDPGIGFGKTFAQNATLLAHCTAFRSIAPLVIGASRKAFIGELTGQPKGAARAAGSLATVAAAARGGAAMVRVHDVRQTVDFLKVLRAIEGGAA